MVAGSRPLIVIVGPTASGKSAVAMAVAERYQGEIIAADSRTVYKGMDIGTAKPSPNDRRRVVHWGLDLIEPTGRFTASDFKSYAEAAIADIRRRHRLPVMVGGTGLYVEAVLLDYGFGPDADLARRARLEKKSLRQLQQDIVRQNLPLPGNAANKRHLIRVLETGGRPAARSPGLRPDAAVFGILPPDAELRRRIDERVEFIFKNGFVDEVRQLVAGYGQKALSRNSGIGYRIAFELLGGAISLDEAKRRFKQADWRYARRQRTWWRRHDFVQWSASGRECQAKIVHFLTSLPK